MDYGDITDGVLGIILGLLLFTCCSSTLLTALFPCSCNPRRDCRRNCGDCKRDREKCWRRICKKRERASTEERLVEDV
jgi:hypothetical protein